MAAVAGIGAVPVIGWVIAGGILAAGVVLGKAAKEKRRAAVSREVTRVSDDITQKVASEMKSQMDKSRDAIIDHVNVSIRNSVEQQKGLAKKIEESLKKTSEARNAEQQQTLRMVDCLKECAKRASDAFDRYSGGFNS